MKVSIWQQYSSNHSSGFTIIGRFQSPQDAESAAAELRQILDDMDRDEQTYTDRGESVYHREQLLPSEERYATKYKINWRRPVDWARGGETVHQMDNLVFISLERETWLGPWPFDELMRRLGGEAMIDGDRAAINALQSLVYISVSANAPDEEVATMLAVETAWYLHKHISPPFHERGLPPWVAYGPFWALDHLPSISFEHLWNQPQNDWFKRTYPDPVDEERVRKAAQTCVDYQRAVLKGVDWEMDFWLDKAVEALLALDSHGYHVNVDGKVLRAELPQIVGRIGAGFRRYVYGGTITKSGVHIELKNLTFGNPAFGLPALIEYLQANGCTNITHYLREEF